MRREDSNFQHSITASCGYEPHMLPLHYLAIY
nr:MAG TPA: hypothetical protein [Crassvirales sp.]